MDERERVARFYVRAWRRRAHACAGSVHEVGGLVVCLTGAPAPWFNATLVSDDGPGVVGDLVAAQAVYPADLGFGVEVLPDLQPHARRAVEAAGFRTIDVSPVMDLDVPALVVPPAPDDLEVTVVTDPAGLDRVAATDASAFGGDAGVTRRFLADGVLEDPAQRVYAGSLGGEVVAAGESCLVDGVLGVFGVATVPPARRRGIGAALTARMIADRADEADLATLDASELGQGVYERLGFRTIMTREVWGPPADPV